MPEDNVNSLKNWLRWAVRKLCDDAVTVKVERPTEDYCVFVVECSQEDYDYLNSTAIRARMGLSSAARRIGKRMDIHTRWNN